VLEWPLGINTGGVVTPSVRVLASGKAAERNKRGGPTTEERLSGHWGPERQGGQYGGEAAASGVGSCQGSQYGGSGGGYG